MLSARKIGKGKTAETRSIAAGEFKAKCLGLLDEVAETRQPLIVTKRGVAVARLIPEPEVKSLFGAMKGSVLWEGDILTPVMDESEWNALK